MWRTNSFYKLCSPLNRCMCINIKCWLISWNNSIYPDDKNLPTNVHPCFTGHGVFTTRIFNKGDFLLEYVGKRICVQEEADAIDKSSFLYGFVFDGKKNW